MTPSPAPADGGQLSPGTGYPVRHPGGLPYIHTPTTTRRFGTVTKRAQLKNACLRPGPRLAPLSPSELLCPGSSRERQNVKMLAREQRAAAAVFLIKKAATRGGPSPPAGSVVSTMGTRGSGWQTLLSAGCTRTERQQASGVQGPSPALLQGGGSAAALLPSPHLLRQSGDVD